MSAKSTRLPAQLSKGLRRSRRAALRRLPGPVASRLRFAKWAVVGPPEGMTVRRKQVVAVRPKTQARPVAPRADKKVVRKFDPASSAITTSSGVVVPAPADVPAGVSGQEVRRKFLFETANPAGSMLEIGPAYAPVLAKRDGFNTKTVDHLDRLGLAEKYKEHDKTLDQFEEVDFVLVPGVTMSELISDRFDLVLASHVIEHTTSLIHFINECSSLLTDDGTLGLVIPDHRFCFDRFRERSSLGAVIDASLGQVDVHTKGTLTEFTLSCVNRGGPVAWTPGHKGSYAWLSDMNAARNMAKESESGTYVDAHHWVFTPNHMRLLLHDLAELGYISLREAFFHNTMGCEFFLNLKADGSGPSLSRQELVELSDAERRSLDVPVFESVTPASVITPTA